MHLQNKIIYFAYILILCDHVLGIFCTFYYLLGEQKIKILKLDLGIAEKTYKTKWGCDHAASNKPTNP